MDSSASFVSFYLYLEFDSARSSASYTTAASMSLLFHGLYLYEAFNLHNFKSIH